MRTLFITLLGMALTVSSATAEGTPADPANVWRARPWLALDLDVALSSTRFIDDAPEADVIPGSVATALTGGVAISNLHRFSGDLRVRYFGRRPLFAADSAGPKASALLCGSVGVTLKSGLFLGIEVFNVLNAQASDIDNLYASRLMAEPEPVDDVHFDPVEPRTVSLRLSYAF